MTNSLVVPISSALTDRISTTSHGSPVSLPVPFAPSQVRLTGDSPLDHTQDSRHGKDDDFLYSATSPLFDQIRLSNNPDIDIDIDGHSEAAVIYTLLAISSLSVIDNTIGLVVAARRSLRLTQVAFAIWCLRFLFRTLSLITILFMMAVGVEFERGHLPLGLDFSNNSQGYRKSSMMAVTVLEAVVAAAHGWSLLVLIRDLRNQPRPRTLITRIWTWFCGSKYGSRLKLGHYTGGNSGNNSSIRYIEENTAWDREVAASFGLGGRFSSSSSSIRSVVASIPEMSIAVATSPSRASSISSAEKDAG